MLSSFPKEDCLSLLAWRDATNQEEIDPDADITNLIPVRPDLIEEKSLEAEKQKQRAVRLLEEAARSDRLVAHERFQRGEDADALAYLARASRYVPNSSLPGESAISSALGITVTGLSLVLVSGLHMKIEDT